MKISDFIPSRDNNFNLTRIIAAYAVLITHIRVSYWYVGSGTVSPHHWYENVNHTQKLLNAIGSRYPFPNTSLMGRLDKAFFTQWRKR